MLTAPSLLLYQPCPGGWPTSFMHSLLQHSFIQDCEHVQTSPMSGSLYPSRPSAWGPVARRNKVRKKSRDNKTPCLLPRDVEEDANLIADGLLSELRDSTVVPLLLNPFAVKYNAILKTLWHWGGGVMPIICYLKLEQFFALLTCLWGNDSRREFLSSVKLFKFFYWGETFRNIPILNCFIHQKKLSMAALIPW